MTPNFKKYENNEVSHSGAQSVKNANTLVRKGIKT
jgi:hypothetical protein